jgi:hypothetical protein
MYVLPEALSVTWKKLKSLYFQVLEMFTEMGADGYVEVVKERLDDLGSLGKINP